MNITHSTLLKKFKKKSTDHINDTSLIRKFNKKVNFVSNGSKYKHFGVPKVKRIEKKTRRVLAIIDLTIILLDIFVLTFLYFQVNRIFYSKHFDNYTFNHYEISDQGNIMRIISLSVSIFNCIFIL